MNIFEELRCDFSQLPVGTEPRKVLFSKAKWEELVDELTNNPKMMNSNIRMSFLKELDEEHNIFPTSFYCKSTNITFCRNPYIDGMRIVYSKNKSKKESKK
jgi:hypothetical protein